MESMMKRGRERMSMKKRNREDAEDSRGERKLKRKKSLIPFMLLYLHRRLISTILSLLGYIICPAFATPSPFPSRSTFILPPGQTSATPLPPSTTSSKQTPAYTYEYHQPPSSTLPRFRAHPTPRAFPQRSSRVRDSPLTRHLHAPLD